MSQNGVTRMRRRSRRENQGQPPCRYGEWEDARERAGQVLELDQVLCGNERGRSAPEDAVVDHPEGEERNTGRIPGRAQTEGFRCPEGPPSATRPVPSRSGSQHSRGSEASKRSSVLCRERQLELEAAQKLARLEDEAEMRKLEALRLEIEQRKLAREQDLVRQELNLRRAEIQMELDDTFGGEFGESKSQKLDDDIREDDLVQTFLVEEPEMPDKRVEDWVEQNKAATTPHFGDPVGQMSDALTQALQMCISKMGSSSNNNNQPLLPSLRELTPFGGEPEEWPNFHAEYQGSKDRFSDVDNMARLRKCLKGRAKDAVQAMMIVPANVNRVMETLECSFGRPEQIVSSLISKARTIPNPTEDRPETLLDFSNAVQNLVATMETLGRTGHLMNPQLISDLVEKLPMYATVQWAQSSCQIQGELSLKNFSEWLTSFSRSMARVKSSGVEVVGNGPADNRGDRHNSRRHRESVMATTEDQELDVRRTMRCPRCRRSGHELVRCRDFLSDSTQQRWNSVRRSRSCFCCLKEGHMTTSCPEKKACGVGGCQDSHHSLLHKTERKPVNFVLEEEEAETVGHTTLQTNSGRKVLLKVIPLTLQGPKGEISTHALLDEGSTVTLVHADLARKIGVTGSSEPLHLRWMNSENPQTCESYRISLRAVGANGETCQMVGARTTPSLDLPVQTVNVENLKRRWSHLKKVDLSQFSNAKPQILIGQDNWDLISTLDVIRGPKNAPALSRTRLGWVLHGNVTDVQGSRRTDLALNVWEQEDDLLHQMVKQSFSTEDFGVKIMENLPMSNDNARAIEIMNETTRRVGDRWETGLMWKSDNLVLPESKTAALRRLFSIERKMDKDPAFAEQYIAKMEENFKKGYARKLTSGEAAVEGPHTWYLPHFGVTNPNKPGKLRVVFDAAARSHGVSLNDSLLQGPDLMCPLVAVLFKFRQRRIAFAADIKEMFPQVKIAPGDLSAQRFFWRGADRDRPPDVNVMTSMIFGAVSSPCQAQEVKNRNAREFVSEFPKSVDAIIRKHYVDDYLDSEDTVHEAEKVVSGVIEVHRRGAFEIRNWISNSKKLLALIPPDLRASGEKEFDVDSEMPFERVLGLNWNPNEDVFKFNLKFHRVPTEVVDGLRRPTKREVLKLVMSVFDPLGFLASFMVKAKILLQEIWRTKINWDDEITESSHFKWTLWLDSLKDIQNFQIPRCYSLRMKLSKFIQLHIFCDASEEAFAAVGYFRVEIEGGDVETSLVMAKTRVAPLRPMSIPRLELQAAVMATRLAILIKNDHDLRIDSTHFWTDSKTVLLWIKSDARNFKPFVAHRVGEIAESTDPQCWKWVSTLENVADEATRDNKEVDFSSESRWLTGPTFLKGPESKWPVENASKTVPDDKELELKPQFVGVIVPVENPSLPDVTRFSNFSRLIRSTAWVSRFGNQCLQRNVTSSDIQMDEWRKAEIRWWKEVQSQHFYEDVRKVKDGNPVNPQSYLSNYSCFLDEQGVMRIKGRTRFAESLDYDVKYPVVLHPKHQFARLLIQHFHVKAGHHGQEFVLNEIKQMYWMPKMRSAVRSCWNHCQHCKIQRLKPDPPQMAPLPDVRLDRPPRPFAWVGMDYFGPYEVTVGRRHEKRYGVLFTCLSTRAVHLELANSLSTDSTILAIRRMAGRRGDPLKIYSDNGTNLRGAQKELAASLKEMDQDKIVTELSSRGTEWFFIPPSAPHMGGSWERLVRSVKVALAATLKENNPGAEVLQTLLVEAERVVNSRPLTHVSVDPDDSEALTPNHFLLGSSTGKSISPGVFVDKDLLGRKHWRQSQRLADLFWSRWIREYLPTLTRRTKWNLQTRPIKVGDLVFIADGTLTRGSWPRGIVVKTHPGRDGIIRVVEVETPTGSYRRPVTKVCVLDCQNEVNESSLVHGGG